MLSQKHFEKTLNEITNLVLDMLADLPPEKAKAAKSEMRRLVRGDNRDS
jgi:hypothetical protein